MTKENIIDNIARLNSETWRDREEVRTEIGKLLSELKKALEQQPSDDVMVIHTQGLDEGIRCAMCTNSMKSDRGCDGGCRVDNDMYKKVMDTIKNHIVAPVTPAQRWIPCSERLPEEIGTYLVTLEYKEHGKGITTLWYHGKQFGWDLRVADIVIAWMPLPQPYEEKRGNENDI